MNLQEELLKTERKRNFSERFPKVFIEGLPSFLMGYSHGKEIVVGAEYFIALGGATWIGATIIQNKKPIYREIKKQNLAIDLKKNELVACKSKNHI